MRDLLYLVTLNESASRSGLSLNSLHSFFVLSLSIIDKLAISISISYSSEYHLKIHFFWVILVRLALLLTS